MGKWRTIGICTLGTTILMASPGATAPKPPKDDPPPAQVTALLNCRGIADSAERLACYDKATASIGDAVAKRDLVVFDRESVKKTKRGLFGFAISGLGVFGDDDDEVEIKQIDGTIAGYSHNADGGYVFRLVDGSRWSQQDGKPLAIPPQNGDKVIVKKGSLGAYFLSVARQPGVKVKRIN